MKNTSFPVSVKILNHCSTSPTQPDSVNLYKSDRKRHFKAFKEELINIYCHEKHLEMANLLLPLKIIYGLTFSTQKFNKIQSEKFLYFQAKEGSEST